MLKKIFTLFLFVIAVLIALIIGQPDEFRVTRSTMIAAPMPLVFEKINNLHNWETWSPWAKLDPKAKTGYNGPAAGLGASFQWAGNSKVGVGRMTITESIPSSLILFRLDFQEPFASTSSAEFNLVEIEGKTKVRWSMFGKNNLIGKAISLFMDCDKMVGDQFEKGLGDLKSQAEQAAAS